ncbi:hypothetical protein [Fredinandcohnia onubensis]|uniref:hypothetical protein n=1 Tax=Fredinandcohnia onubensis TaxID=1571209 RepID=UPI000C0BEFAB|nr:hypothetical protein [Fredinandcohnia onubensis]
MLLGMVLSNDKETIVPIVEGEIARIYDTETGQFTDAPNPALGLKEGRRGATVNWMVNNGVKILCAPPGMLCELSYSKAQEKQLTFYRLEPSTKFITLQNQIKSGQLNLSETLPDNEVEPSGPVTK